VVVGSLRVGSEDRTRLHVRRDRARADEARRRIPPLGGALGAYLNAFSRTTDLTATFGTAGRNIVRGPESFNVELSLTKRTRFSRVESELRIEAFNLFNHAQFALPDPRFGTSELRRDHEDGRERRLHHARHHGATDPVRAQAPVLTGAVGAGRTKRCGYWARFSNAATLSSSRFRASTLFARLRNSPVFC